VFAGCKSIFIAGWIEAQAGISEVPLEANEDQPSGCDVEVRNIKNLVHEKGNMQMGKALG
jgi:hypothetical protein